ncbi:MAG: S49 family peptidase [Fluviibacter sp.]
MSVAKFAQLRARAFNRPLLLEPGYASHFFAYFGSRVGAESLINADGDRIDDLVAHAESYTTRRGRFNAQSGRYEPYAIDGNGIATIAIEGTLVHKLGMLDPYSGMQGYDGIIAKLAEASSDSRVRAVLLDIHSPGGEVSGVYDAAMAVAKFNKPIAALANDMMTSAAYLIASQANTIYATPTADVGSIGVVVAHFDVSRAMEAQGVRVTLITAGEHKADGNPYEPLPTDVVIETKAKLEKSRRQFATVVASKRGVSVDSLLETEASVYSASDARRLGLVDAVMLPSAVPEHFARQIKGGQPAKSTNRGNRMDPQNEVEAEMMTQAQHATALAQASETARAEAFAAGVEQGRAEGTQAGAKLERERIGAILASAPAATRREFATHVAMTTDMPADQAIAMIGAAPEPGAGTVNVQALAALSSGARAPIDTADTPRQTTGHDRLTAAAERIGVSLVK